MLQKEDVKSIYANICKVDSEAESEVIGIPVILIVPPFIKRKE